MKANLLSPTLANLDRIADTVTPCTVGTSGKIDSAIRCKSVSPIRSAPCADKSVDGTDDAGASMTTGPKPRCPAAMSLVNGDEKLAVNCSGKMKNSRERGPITATTASLSTTAVTAATRNKTNSLQDINADDDEEIDVERVDERDPMWRPW